MTLAWNDTRCSLCGELAQYRTLMYLEHKPVNGLEYLCAPCTESATLPEHRVVLVTQCAAEPDTRRRSAAAWCEVFQVLAAAEETQRHFLCSKHIWCWRHSLGPEWEMRVQALDPSGREIGEARAYQRDDLA